MDERAREALGAHVGILCCPRCGGGLALGGEALACRACGQGYPVVGNIPQLFWPNEWEEGTHDVTEAVRSFYEETPFPDYDDFDSVDSLARKARQGLFAKLLDEQVPPGVRVIECGCGTGQLSAFLSVANRTVFGTDLCLNSLRLGQAFKEQNELGQVHFLQMNLFRPAFQPGSFDLVISNGVLHHTSDPRRAFESIARLVRPGGYVLVGLYHRYGRLVTDLRRLLFRLSGDRFTALDPNLRDASHSAARHRAWFMDQYRHPHETKHSMDEVLQWFDRYGVDFVNGIPHLDGSDFSTDERLFAPHSPGSTASRYLTQLGMLLTGGQDGGLFIMIGRKR